MDANLEELQAIESALKGIQDLMEEMEIPNLGELEKIHAELVAIKKAKEDA